MADVRLPDLPAASAVADADIMIIDNGVSTQQATAAMVRDPVRKQVQDGSLVWCGTAGGTANALTLAPSPAITAYVAGQEFQFTASASNTGAATVKVSGLSAKPIQNAGAALVSGNIVAGRAYSIVYTGSAFQIAAHSLVVPVPVATETVSGISRRATIAEAKSGVSTTPAALPYVTPEGVAAAITALAPVPTVDKWSMRIIGEPFVIWDHLTGAEVPPTAAGGPRFIKLTAADAYNTGLLSGETISGTAPLLYASATISLSSSPLYNKEVRLINTERRFLRAGNSGTPEDDALQGHFHNLYHYIIGYPQGGEGTVTDNFNNTAPNHSITGRVREPITDGTNGAPRTANETRGRNIGATAYMRIF